jgi:4-hydroxy-tetrahydrodipicolinate reductase
VHSGGHRMDRAGTGEGRAGCARPLVRCAVSRSAAGSDLGEALGEQALGVPVYATVREALDGVDVLIDYTSVTAVKDTALAAIEAGVSVVIGTSGLTASDFDALLLSED